MRIDDLVDDYVGWACKKARPIERYCEKLNSTEKFTNMLIANSIILSVSAILIISLLLILFGAIVAMVVAFFGMVYVMINYPITIIPTIAGILLFFALRETIKDRKKIAERDKNS